MRQKILDWDRALVDDYFYGRRAGLRKGFEKGETIGLAKGETIGLAKGETIGLAKGETIGLAKGETIGLARGLAKGKTIGHTEGKTIGHIEGKIESVLTVLQTRFKKIPKQIESTIRNIDDPAVLETLIVQSVACKTLNEFAQSLN
jgi:flagellar biosynthesis/type III secretory pathway protein FliH